MRPERLHPVAGVVLAAGTSTRMGKNKLLFQLDGETILKRAVVRALAARLDPVLVVVGHEAELALEELSGLPVQPVWNPDYASGIHSSLSAGIAAIPTGVGAAVVVLADMPLVTDRMIATLVERYRESEAPLVISDYSGVQAPPTLYDRSLFDELHRTPGEGCAKQVVRHHRAEALAVAWPRAALTDVDRREDFERLSDELG